MANGNQEDGLREESKAVVGWGTFGISLQFTENTALWRHSIPFSEGYRMNWNLGGLWEPGVPLDEGCDECRNSAIRDHFCGGYALCDKNLIWELAPTSRAEVRPMVLVELKGWGRVNFLEKGHCATTVIYPTRLALVCCACFSSGQIRSANEVVVFAENPLDFRFVGEGCCSEHLEERLEAAERKLEEWIPQSIDEVSCYEEEGTPQSLQRGDLKHFLVRVVPASNVESEILSRYGIAKVDLQEFQQFNKATENDQTRPLKGEAVPGAASEIKTAANRQPVTWADFSMLKERLGDFNIVYEDGSKVPASEDVERFFSLVSELLIHKEAEAESAVRNGPIGKAAELLCSAQGRGLSKVAGMHALKNLLRKEVIRPFRDPKPFVRYGLTIPNGILLYGPPGCGKTYIARQLADELGFSFVELIPSEVASIYVHGSVSRIREVFDKAQEQAPSVLFIDEFEALAPSRADLGGFQQHKSEEVNEFLAHMNECAAKNVLVIAATNEPQKIDSAILRTGRLDKHIYVPPPDAKAREEMLALHLSGRPIDPKIDLGEIASDMKFYSASDIRFIVDEAARDAMEHDQPISAQHIESAKRRVPPSVTDEDVQRYLVFRTRGVAS